MTYGEAKRKLPKWAKGLAEGAYTLIALRTAVEFELQLYGEGMNPMAPAQVASLNRWLRATA